MTSINDQHLKPASELRGIPCSLRACNPSYLEHYCQALEAHTQVPDGLPIKRAPIYIEDINEADDSWRLFLLREQPRHANPIEISPGQTAHEIPITLQDDPLSLVHINFEEPAWKTVSKLLDPSKKRKRTDDTKPEPCRSKVLKFQPPSSSSIMQRVSAEQNFCVMSSSMQVDRYPTLKACKLTLWQVPASSPQSTELPDRPDSPGLWEELVSKFSEEDLSFLIDPVEERNYSVGTP
eukprot:TRINITY_DN43928_c0_g1_i1.p1 TRINITY_DN43928_c0_g1~~TRINITY_DN43928_c0_g1_i1.p1  ORF type:complete len:237 (+),score=26.64 TRINITY_DN43928_c0_g1_i1:618-1328(+)